MFQGGTLGLQLKGSRLFPLKLSPKLSLKLLKSTTLFFTETMDMSLYKMEDP